MTDPDLPFGGTRAAEMLAASLKRYTAENRGGLRALAARVGMKQATVLSHMGTGRIGIPLDRVQQLAEILDLDPHEFAAAALDQRAPGLFQFVASATSTAQEPTVDQLYKIVGRVSGLQPEQVSAIQHILRSGNPKARWSTGTEAELVDYVRKYFPFGLSDSDLAAVKSAISKA